MQMLPPDPKVRHAREIARDYRAAPIAQCDASNMPAFGLTLDRRASWPG